MNTERNYTSFTELHIWLLFVPPSSPTAVAFYLFRISSLIIFQYGDGYVCEKNCLIKASNFTNLYLFTVCDRISQRTRIEQSAIQLVDQIECQYQRREYLAGKTDCAINLHCTRPLQYIKKKMNWGYLFKHTSDWNLQGRLYTPCIRFSHPE